MGFEKIQETLEKDPVIKWLDKKMYIDSEENFEIVDVQSLDGDIVLTLKHNAEAEQYVRISSSMKNDLIDHFGPSIREWKLRDVIIKFSKFTPKASQKNISEGVSMQFVWTETEDIAF